MLTSAALYVLIAQQAAPQKVADPSDYTLVIASNRTWSDEEADKLIQQGQLLEPKSSKKFAHATLIREGQTVLAIDGESLGIEFLTDFAAAVKTQIDSPEPEWCSEALQNAILPLVAFGIPADSLSSMSRFEVTPGYRVVFEKDGKAVREFERFNQKLHPADPTEKKMPTNLSSLLNKEQFFKLQKIQLSVSGQMLPSIKIREIQQRCLDLAWKMYESARLEYNDSIKILSSKLCENKLPVLIDSSFAGHSLNSFDREKYAYLYAFANDPNGTNFDPSELTVRSANPTLYIHCKFLLKDGTTDGAIFRMPSQID